MSPSLSYVQDPPVKPDVFWTASFWRAWPFSDSEFRPLCCHDPKFPYTRITQTSIESVPNVVPARWGKCPHFQRNYGRITEVVYWEAHLPQRWCAEAPLLSGPVTFRFIFVGVPQRKSVRRQATRYSSVAECNWEGTACHTLPNVWAGDDQLLLEAERVRQKQGSSFKRRYFSCLTIFF